MSDLISRQALIEDIRKRSYINKALCEIFETIIDEQPTAYNPEKVVEELEEKQEKWKAQLQENDTNFLDNEILKQYVKHYDMAIDIVKRGGVE